MKPIFCEENNSPLGGATGGTSDFPSGSRMVRSGAHYPQDSLSKITYIACIYAWILVFYQQTCVALYEDQVGKFDWKQQYVGAILRAHFDNSPGSRRIVVATEQNVIAAINPRTSQLAWRQILESGKAGAIKALAVGDEIVSVSGSESHIRGWDIGTGHLNWETNTVASNSDGASTHFYHINVKDGTLIVIDAFESAFLQLKYYNYHSGELISSNRIAAPWFTNHSSCAFISKSFFICVDSHAATIHSLSLNNEPRFHQTPLQNLGISTTGEEPRLDTILDENSNIKHLFAIRIGPLRCIFLRATDKGIDIVKQEEEVSALSGFQINEDVLLFFLKWTIDGTCKLKVYNVTSSSYTDELQGEFLLPWHHGKPDKVFAYVILKKEGGYGYRLLISTTVHSLLLVQNPGKVVWIREESLASVLTAEMVDLPVSESEAQMEEQFAMTNKNIMMLFYKRLTTQLLQLQYFLAHILSSIHNEATGTTANTESAPVLIRDDFNIHKVIVLVTSVGKIFGLDNLTGKIIWQHFIPDLEPFDRYNKLTLLLFVQRTSTHYPHPPQCVVLGRHKDIKTGMLYVFNPLTGAPSGSDGIVHLDYRVVQASQLPFPNAKFLRGLLLVDDNYKVHVYPDTALDVTLQNAESLYVFTANADTGELQGFSLTYSTPQELITEKTWSLNFPTASQTITNVVMKRPIEHVHSQGRVMGDRSVLYKYLNPNLAVITTECYHPTQKSSLNVYLVDVVSGKIVSSYSHKKAKGPVHVVHSENWIMYTYFNEKHRRVEVAILELYEGKIQSNTTAFSSLALPPSPMIERQAYIFPYFIDAATVTITEKGITNKHLLYFLPFGGIVELPKAFLDPRRSLFPTLEHREEGIFPYNPELPVIPENRINYYQSVHKIREIYTAPTGLESTCLVLAYGLDLFFTRVAPSRTFDVLKEDFDHWLIVTVLLGLIGASYLTKKLAAKKALKQAWK